MSPESLIPLLVILPLSGFAITALIGRRLGKQAHWIPVLAILAVWLIAMAVSFAALPAPSRSASTATAPRSSTGSRPARSTSRPASSSTS